MFNRDPAARKAAEAAPSRSRRRAPREAAGAPVAIFAVGWLLVSLAVMGAVLAALFLSLDGPLKQEARQRAEAAAGRLQAGLGQQVAHVRGTLSTLAGDSALAELATETPGGALPLAPPPYSLALPDAQRLLLLPAGYRRPSPEAQPPVGYALLDLVGQAETIPLHSWPRPWPRRSPAR